MSDRPAISGHTSRHGSPSSTGTRGEKVSPAPAKLQKRREREREIQSSAEQRGDRLIGSPFSLIDLAIRLPRSVSAGNLLR
ncbi:hypothetical protein F2Q68_00029056 [Brassica cretica]|nr:hypothetical protein F2Q68_00029056 [Brassica cretica]